MNKLISFQIRLYEIFQFVLACIPKLSFINWGTSKALAFLRAWNYLLWAKVSGDYLEFGVFTGTSFKLALRMASHFHKKPSPDSPRFFAFDSFQGLTKPHLGKDGLCWGEGQYKCTEEIFKRNIRWAEMGWKVEVIPGVFETSLKPELLTTLGLKKAAFINIDCDLYSPTLSALRFCVPILQPGTIIYFDDWFSSGDMSKGEPRACKEWLKEFPQFQLIEFESIPINGKMFIVNYKDEK